jgi:hypothetical protein
MKIRINPVIIPAVFLGVLAFATSRAAAANLLVDPEFDGIPALNTFVNVFGPPFITGQWGAENGAIVGVDGGVTPRTARTMLAEYSPAGGYTQTMQATDVSSFPALSTFNLSAYFNGNMNLAAPQGFVNLSFYDASYNQVGAANSAGLVLDNSPLTWQQISLTLAEPLNTKYVVSQVLYLESTLTDSSGAIWPGYVDSASLTVVPEPSVFALLVVGAVALAGRRFIGGRAASCQLQAVG